LRARCDSTIIGTDALRAVEAARQLGFAGTAKYTLTLGELREVTATGHYPIVFISLLPLDANPDIHAVVVVDFTAQDVLILDPLQGERSVPLQIFNSAWMMGRNLAILIAR
jgi:ABC-type bacteriocin/lantibiotic exporter with double-glycine peptidase domain